MSQLALDHTFVGRRIPPWLRRFEAEPEKALRQLLLGGADLEHLNPADPERVLLDWIESLGPETGLLPAVDRALVAWIDSSWGDPDPDGLGAAVAALAWCRAADLIGGCLDEQGLAGAAKALRERFLEEPAFLRSIAEGRARDPEARAWLALAEHQADRELLPRWWSLCSLPPDVPWYHGEIGVHGLRGLPPESPNRAGGFPKEVPEGLARLADALARRVEDGWLDAERARAEFTATARLTMAAYPFAREKWLPFWRHVLQDGRLREPAAEHWVRDLSPKLEHVAEKSPSARPRWSEPDPGWARRATEIATNLKQGEHTAFELANRLLEEQRVYAQSSGDTFFLVRSACNFAGALRKMNPRKALDWARLALDSDPWNAFAWTTTAAVNLTLSNLAEAAEAAHEAIRRFPNNPVAHNGLAEVLKAQGRLDEAERVYRFATKRFSEDPVAHNGLAEILKAQGRFDEAERVYRLATKGFPDNPVVHNGLAEVLKAQGKFDEAEETYWHVLQRFRDRPEAVYALSALAGLLRRRGELGEAERLFVEALRRDPHNAATRSALEGLRAQRGEAVVLAESHQAAGTGESRPIEGLEKAPPPKAPGTSRDHLELTHSEPQQRVGPPPAIEPPPVSSEPQPAPHPAKVVHLRHEDIATLLTDTLFLRRWARAIDRDAGLRAGELRERAHAALERLLRWEGRSSLAAGEAGLLTLAEGDLDAGLKLLREAARRFPGSARVRYALARAERLAASARALDANNPEAPIRPWRRLARLEPQLSPVALLGEARTWLLQTDGTVREAGARRSLGGLAWWIDSQLARDQRKSEFTEFNAWWARETQRMVFGTRTDRVEEDLAGLPFYLDMIQSHAPELDLHEEEPVYRVATA